MADVKCDKLKPPAKAMFDQATKAAGRVKNLEDLGPARRSRRRPGPPLSKRCRTRSMLPPS